MNKSNEPKTLIKGAMNIYLNKLGSHFCKKSELMGPQKAVMIRPIRSKHDKIKHSCLQLHINILITSHETMEMILAIIAMTG